MTELEDQSTGAANLDSAVVFCLIPMTDAAERRFRTLYQEHYEKLLAYAVRRCPDSSEAHDVVAEVFLVLWRRLDEAPPDDREVPLWLFGVARRVLSNRQRAAQRRRRLITRVAWNLGHVPSVDEGVAGDPGARGVLAGLARLDDADREILMLAAWEELSTRDIATVLGCSANAAAIRLHRARKRLREEVAKETALGGDKEEGVPLRQTTDAGQEP